MPTSHQLRMGFSVSILLLGGALTASANAPPQTEPADRLGRILNDWQQTTAAHSSLDIRFSGKVRSPAWGDDPFTGRVVLLPRGRALVEVERRHREGRPDATERIIWSDEAIHQVLIERKAQFVRPIEAKDRGRLPAVLALSFLWNMSVDGLKSRYRVELLKEDAETWVLAFTPLSEVGRSSFSKAFLQLDRRTFLPRHYVVVGADGKSTTDYRVIESQLDRPIPEEVFRLPDGEGWEVIQPGESKVTNWLSRLFIPDLLP